jgi:hypothetical protein
MDKRIFPIMSIFSHTWQTQFASGVLCGVPLAFSFENENGKLLNLYHGSQKVPLQMLKRFFGLQTANAFVDRCVKKESSVVADLVKDIGGNLLQYSPEEILGVRGAHSKRQLTLFEMEVLNDLSSNEATSSRVCSYKRTYIKRKLLTTENYCLGPQTG